MEKKGLTVNYTLFDEEAELMKCLRNSTEERFGRLRAELWSLCEKHLERPAQLASDYVLARVYKHCLVFLDLDDLLGNRAMENEYYHFKDMFAPKLEKRTSVRPSSPSYDKSIRSKVRSRRANSSQTSWSNKVSTTTTRPSTISS